MPNRISKQGNNTEIAYTARWICDQLPRTMPFTVWLKGNLGAGKTTLVRHILYELGLPQDEPVTSPSYVYLNEYLIGNQTFAHVDLYRVPRNDASSFLDGLDFSRYHGVFIEWPEILQELKLSQPTLTIEISPTSDSYSRIYDVSIP